MIHFNGQDLPFEITSLISCEVTVFVDGQPRSMGILEVVEVLNEQTERELIHNDHMIYRPMNRYILLTINSYGVRHTVRINRGESFTIYDSSIGDQVACRMIEG